MTWIESQQEVVLGAYYYRYAVPQVLGFRFAEKYIPRYSCSLGILVSAILTILTPLAANMGICYVIAARIGIGIFHGFVYTSLYSMFSKWFPKSERASALALITVGGNIGAAFTMPLSGFLSEYGFSGGWPSVFYVTGATSILWVCIWTYYVRDAPEEHSGISTFELNYIQTGLELIRYKKVFSQTYKS